MTKDCPAPMIEKVSRAIARSCGRDDWQNCVPVALAVVAAMREPTTEMLEAAMPDCPDWGYLPEDWKAMMDHVMKEGLTAQET